MKEKDIFGMAMKAYYFKKDKTPIIVHSPDFDDDDIATELAEVFNRGANVVRYVE